MTSRLLVPYIRLPLGLGRIMILPVLVTFTTLIAAFVKNIACLCVISLNNLENDKVTKLCNAAESDEKLFWNLLKGQPSSSQMSAFLVEDKLITDRNLIREMWVNHFEALGTPRTVRILTAIFLLLLVLKTFYAVRIHPEPCVHHWSMKKLLVSAPV